MEFGKAFTFPFEDQEWLMKLGIAALVMLIPILGQFIVMGWALEVTRRVIQRDPQPLPDWSDFVGHLVRGLQVAVIGFVYALPIILLSSCPQILLVAVQEGVSFGRAQARVFGKAEKDLRCADVLAVQEVGAEQRLDHRVLTALQRRETNEPVTGDRVGCASDRLEGEGDAFFLADGADLPVDPFGACGIPELELQVELPIHALSRHVRIELERAPMER